MTHDQFRTMYDAFNARNIDAVLAFLHPNVDWPNGMEGGRVHGHSGVREYWQRQWKVLDPTVTPQRFTLDDAGRVAIDVHQVVRGLDGQVLVDQMVRHIYSFQDGLITHMEIAAPEP
jgi:SnoaL-like domain